MNATRTDLLRLLHQGGYRNLRALSPSDFAPVETPNAAVENPAAVDAFADRHQAQHLFVGVAERLTADGGGSIENCGLLRALFVDIDDKQFADGETGSMRAIVDGPLLSSAMVRSGGGFQLYFALSEPLDLQNGGRPLATKLLKGLAHAYHGDTNAAEPARILRLPGTLNHNWTIRLGP